MSSSSSFPPSRPLFFGLEIELLLRPKPQTLATLINSEGFSPNIYFNHSNASLVSRNRTIVQKYIAKTLVDGGVPTGMVTEKFDTWTVFDESTLDEVQNFWRVELVSRRLETTHRWQKEIDDVFEALLEQWEIRLTTGCSMHVHVSPGDNFDTRYSLSQVRDVMKAVAFYDEAITKVMPADRKENPYAISMFKNGRTYPNLRKRFTEVPARSWAPVFQIFDQMKFKQTFFSQIMGNDRSVSWNLSNLDAACGTIEFRRPPGVSSAVEAKYWVGFALGFVRESLKTDWSRFLATQKHPGVVELRVFVSKGIGRLGRACAGALEAEQIQEDKRPARVFSAAEKHIIESKKASKKNKTSPFAVKINSRPNTPV